MAVDLGVARQFLREKTQEEPLRCKTHIIRALLPQIEKAREAGHEWKKITQWLLELGINDLNRGHLQTIVWRLRHEGEKQEGKKKKTKRPPVPRPPKFEHNPVADKENLL